MTRTTLGLGRHEAAALLEERMKTEGSMGNGGRLTDTRDKVIATVLAGLLLTALYSSGSWLLAVNEARVAVPQLRGDVQAHEKRLDEVEVQQRLDQQWRESVDKRLAEILDEVKGKRGRR